MDLPPGLEKGQWQVETVTEASPSLESETLGFNLHLQPPRGALPGPWVVASLGLQGGILIQPLGLRGRVPGGGEGSPLSLGSSGKRRARGP